MSSTTFKLKEYARLVRLDRPIGIYLVLWPTLWALWFAAEGIPNTLVLVIFIAGVVLMRSAGCAINDFADRKIDPHVERTAQRPLAAGTVTPKEALWVFAILSLIAFVLVIQLNLLTILLSIPAVILAGSYPFTKRYTHLPQAYLGIAFGWAVPMSFAAVTGGVPVSSWWLFSAVVLWALAYDTMYAMTDREDDLKIGVKSTAILFGRWDRLMVALFQVGVTASLWIAGHQLGLSELYYCGLLIISAGFWSYQQWLIRDRDRQRCFQAFLNNHYFGLLIFLLIVAEYLLRR
ncbi:MAG: 4-hydroxybenzoate octaprenyltransferase [Gammaproteobacteria bacterium]|nr:4-hydroxybenzoate octaprenyltransferase [Gammaproteobacteria bacterium]